MNPIYTPSLADISSGSIILTLSAISAAACGNASDAMILNISHLAVIDAGPDATICNNETFMLSNATAQFATSYLWTSSGTGTFNNPALLNPVYFPSADDILIGYVTLTINVTSVAPCSSVSDAMILHMVSLAIVNAGPDVNICESSGSYYLSGSSAQYATSILWTTSGTGVFNNTNVLNPIYTPSTGDIESGSVILTESGSSLCGTVTDAMVLYITRQAFINAGPDVTICEMESYQLNEATSQYATSYIWTTSGTGSFSNSSLLNPVYTPSVNDILNGSVTLIINATSVAPCVGISDAMVLKIINHAEVNVGADDHVCGIS
ncbi:MAG: hypothetical protein IPH88_01755 [Bacteroidales bacterium]|nr:hypothetical protein [Bacteroidales bacterium]